MKKMIIVLLMFLLLTGCTGMNSKFDCPMKGGVRCESLDSVNAKVSSGEIGPDGVQTISNQKLKQPELSCATFYNKKSLRYGETVQHIWIAPFEDTSGNYHQESNIYTIVKSGHWSGDPVKAINNEE